MKTAIFLIFLLNAFITFGDEGEMKAKNEIEVIPNVKYTQGDEKPQFLDIIRPKKNPEKPMPVIVWIHGGGWIGGDKGFGHAKLKPLAERGYFCVTISYRLAPDSIFPAQIEDCKCAVRFLRANAEKYNIDPKRIGAWGSSAGGHLVSLLGTTDGIEELEGNRGWADFSSSVQAVCNERGPSDITKMAHLQHVEKLLGGPLKENLDKAKKASPVTYVSKEDSPFMILMGTKDNLVPIEQGDILAEALEKAGVSVEFLKFEGAGHGGPPFNKPETIEKVIRFFDVNLKKEMQK